MVHPSTMFNKTVYRHVEIYNYNYHRFWVGPVDIYAHVTL